MPSDRRAMPDEPESWGPFEQEPAVRPPAGLRLSEWDDWQSGLLLAALEGLELGAYDRRIVRWLANWESSTVAVIAGWIRRAKARTAYVIAFHWRTLEEEGTGSAVVAGSSPEEAERRWRESDPAEWPKYEVLSVEPLGKQVIGRYDD